ncbi:MAG: MBL fold metallo-hydrolase [Burkholderiales bacterium]|nr:MBL fold metallo-hydrolase [Burkholderiales bacterium]
MQVDLIDYQNGISALDSGFARPRLDAIHLVVENGGVAIIDSGVNASVPLLLAALAAKGLSPADVDYVMLTHIHLDHAGGAGALMAACPNARLTVHPRGARHMIDPSRLWQATVDVYGLKAAQRSYGAIVPVPAGRVIETGEGHRLALRGRELAFFDTPGHARHHVCIRDSATGHFFVGDCFGLAYTELNLHGRQHVFPTASPSQFDPDALKRTIRRIAGCAPDALYLTHYGQVRDVPRIAEDLLRLIDAHTTMAQAVQASGARGAERHALLKAGVREIIADEALRQGWPLAPAALAELFSIDDELNAQGLAIWLDGA